MNSFVRRGVFLLLFLCFVPSDASAQLVGRFFLEKDVFVAGEPISLHFELTNAGLTPMQFAEGNSYSACGGYQIEVSNDPPRNNSTCSSGAGLTAACIIGNHILQPGEVSRDKVLLNVEHELNDPGTFEIRATRILTFEPASPSLLVVSPIAGIQVKTEGGFRIRLEEPGTRNLSVIFQPYLDDLASKDEQRQLHAARVIGSLAHPFLEDTIVAMTSSRALLPFALIGLKRLNTERSRQALAEFVQGTKGYSYQKEQAIKYLSEMGDKKYFPLLLSEARSKEPNQARDYVLAAARLGGEDAIPYVNSLLADPDGFLRASGVMALPNTGSRRAVSLLIGLLRDSNIDVGRLASIGLIHMTHRNPLESGQWFSDVPSTDYANWLRWWSVEGDRATIYGPQQCGRILSLQ